ncbi:MAG: carbohydrate-binding protein, partial [Planctomycetota bacterium]|nr:carbohydrate-binding protein [Planctomycetota bacterium]
LEAEHYDVGCNGHAYSDLDNINEGGQFRNDGVDVEIAYDEVQGYNIGWLRDGEWINYTVEVAESRDYSLDLRVASAGDGSVMRLTIDGVDLAGPIAIEPTGTWQTWTTLTVPEVFLDEGVHELRLEIDGGDFNLNYIDVQ